MSSTLELKGYSIEEIPLEEVPTAWYQHKDGRVVKLPASPYYSNYYRSKGLKLVGGEHTEEESILKTANTTRR